MTDDTNMLKYDLEDWNKVHVLSNGGVIVLPPEPPNSLFHEYLQHFQT